MGMILLTSIILFALAADAQTLASATAASSQSLTPTNVVLDYDLTRVDSNIKPGDTAVLQVVIKNVGQQSAENVQIYVPESGDLSVGKRWDVGRLDPLGTKMVSTTIAVSKTAQIGLHTLQVRISFDGYDSKGDRKNNQLSVWEFPLRVYGNANFQVTVDKSVFYKGVNKKLVITGINQDGARDVYATLVAGSSVPSASAASLSTAASFACASIIGTSKTYVGNLGNDDNFKIEYFIQPNVVGVCPFTLLIEYNDISGNPLKETLPLGIDVQRYDVDFKVTDVSYTGASPGAASNITVSISNVGSADANDVSVTLDLNSPFTAIGSSEKYVGKIASREEKEISFQSLVDSTADIKAYDIPMTVDYFDSSGNKQTIHKSIGIQVDGKPEIKIFLEKADLFTAGSKGKVTLNVVNKGFAEVKFLNLKILPTENYAVLSSTETYIGNLDSDATDSQEFEIQLKDNVQPGQMPVKFEVTYKEKNSNVDHIDPVNLEINVLSMQEYAQKQPTGSPVSILISIVGVIVGAVVGIIVVWFLYKLIRAIIGFLDNKLFKRKG